MTNLLWHQLKIFISIAYNFENFWSYFLENLSILFSSCAINFYVQSTIVFVNFVHRFFFVFSASYLHSELMVTATKFSLFIQTNYEQNTHGSLWTKMAIIYERRWDTLQYRMQKLKNWFYLFSCIWVKLSCIIRPVNAKKLIKSKVWLYIIFALHSNFWFWQFRVCITSCPSKSTLQISASTFEIHRPMLLYRTVCRTLYCMWPSFGYFSTVI